MLLQRENTDCTALMALQQLRTHPAADPATLVAIEGTISQLQGRARLHRAIARELDALFACTHAVALLHDVGLALAGARVTIDHLLLDHAARIWVCFNQQAGQPVAAALSVSHVHALSRMVRELGMPTRTVTQVWLMPQNSRAAADASDRQCVLVDRMGYFLGSPTPSVSPSTLVAVAKALAALQTAAGITDWHHHWLTHFRLPAVYSLTQARQARKLRAQAHAALALEALPGQ